MKKSKITTVFVMILMVTTVFSFSKTAIADTVFDEQNGWNNLYSMPENYCVVSQKISYDSDAHELTKAKLYFLNPPQYTPCYDKIYVGLSETHNQIDPNNWETFVSEAACYCEGWTEFDFPDYDAAGKPDDIIYLMIGYQVVQTPDGTIDLAYTTSADSDPYPDGNSFTFDGNEWTSQYNHDIAFKLYGNHNNPPSPTEYSPDDGAVDQPLDVTLSVTAEDYDGDSFMISFYDDNENLIDEDYVYDGGPGSVNVDWINLDSATTYKWYCILSDPYEPNVRLPGTGYYEFTTKNANPPSSPSHFEVTGYTKTSIDLEWDKGSGSDKTLIRRKTGGYPSSRSDGTEVYFGTANSKTDSGLSPGTKYYYCAWAYDSGSGLYSANCDSVSKTTKDDDPDPSVSLSPSSHGFGDVEVSSCSSSFSFTLTNDGGGTATGSVSLGGSNPGQFDIVSGSGSFSLGADDSKTVKVKFCPTSEGSKSAYIDVVCDNCDDVSSSLSGTGIDSDVSPTCSISASPSSGKVPLDTTFTISASDSDGSVDSWELDVDNDGSCDYSGSGNPPSSKTHTYSSAGDYTAVLKVWDDEGNSGSDSCTVVVNPGNRAPNKPVCESPSKNARDISLTAYLEWLCSDPDGDDLKFDIYFGRTPNPIKRETNFEMDPSDDVFKYDPGDLNFNKDYYWKIVARDSSGLETEGDVWHFHTQRNQDPQDGRWGLIVAPFTNDDAYKGVEGHIDEIEATFEANGWNNVFTLEDCKYGEFEEYFDKGGKLRENVKGGNKVVIWFLSHGLNMFGGEIAFRNFLGWDYNPALIGQWKKYSDIDSCVSKLNSDADISIIINACYSGSAIDDFRGSNRVVVTATNSNEEGKGMHFSKDLLKGFKGFTDLDTDKYNGNDDGIVSIEEAFSYALENKADGTHPQKDDGNRNCDMGLVDVPFYGNLREYQEYDSVPRSIEENGDWYAQSFTASFEVLTEVYLNMFVSGEHDDSTFEVSIRKADIDDSNKPGEIIHSQTMNFTNRGDSYEWWDKPILINGGDGIGVERDQKYFIVVKSTDGEICWNRMNDNMYNRGESYRSSDDGETWTEISNGYDFSFYVFGNVNIVSKDKLQDYPFLSFVRNNVMLPFFRLLGEMPFFQKLDSMFDLPILK